MDNYFFLKLFIFILLLCHGVSMSLRSIKKDMVGEVKLYHKDPYKYGVLQICKLLELLETERLMPLKDAKKILDEYVKYGTIPDKPVV